jgi:hypothetical protein
MLSAVVVRSSVTSHTAPRAAKPKRKAAKEANDDSGPVQVRRQGVRET